ncbi:Helix-loop-helix protein 6 [Blattella germanica]|nr:Helix-loop-helix protein 6 [Blattella germanica]
MPQKETESVPWLVDLDSGRCGCDRRADPFLPENRIPLPKFVCSKADIEDHLFCAVSAPTSGRRRNERERQRVRSVNEGFERLRRYLPIPEADRKRYSRRRCSKVDVLRAAILYIRHLQELLGDVVPPDSRQQYVQ